jgi:mRNA interferase RelE/StbE
MTSPPATRAAPESLCSDEHAWRYRIGDWRMICDLADASRTISVVRIGHRSDVYRN